MAQGSWCPKTLLFCIIFFGSCSHLVFAHAPLKAIAASMLQLPIFGRFAVYFMESSDRACKNSMAHFGPRCALNGYSLIDRLAHRFVYSIVARSFVIFANFGTNRPPEDRPGAILSCLGPSGNRLGDRGPSESRPKPPGICPRASGSLSGNRPGPSGVVWEPSGSRFKRAPNPNSRAISSRNEFTSFLARPAEL